MKQRTRNLPDADLRGRVRRRPTEPPKRRTMSVKLYGGPLDGQVVALPRGAEVFHVGPLPRPFFTYTYAGKEGRQVIFARAPKSAKVRKFIYWAVGKQGKDPRVEAQYHRGKPAVSQRVAHGRGAAKRRARADGPVQAA